MLEQHSLFDVRGSEHATALLDVLLGEYRFHDGITLYHGPGAVYEEISLTEIHESVHLHLCTLTSYGVFQRFISGLISHPGTPEPYRTEVSESPEGPWTRLGDAFGERAFDLADAGVSRARYVRVESLAQEADVLGGLGSPYYPGPEIDAVGAVYPAP